MTRDKPWRQDNTLRPRYLIHYTDTQGNERGGVMRHFDERLKIGDTFHGVEGVVTVTRVEESEAFLGLGHAWCEPT